MRIESIATISPRPFQTRRIISFGAVCFATVILFGELSGAAAPAAASMKMEVQLVWGTNDKKSPDATHKPVGPELRKKLEGVPFKWSHYFEVKRLIFEVPPTGSTNVALSGKCRLEVKNAGHSKIEVSYFGKGERLETRTQALPKGETLIYGGEAPGATSWFVVVRRLD
jgi:hypothetical protein